MHSKLILFSVVSSQLLDKELDRQEAKRWALLGKPKGHKWWLDMDTAGTSGINASAEGAGAKTILLPDAFNVLNGWLWVATPGETFLHSASLASGIGLHFPAAPTTLTNWNAGLVFAER